MITVSTRVCWLLAKDPLWSGAISSEEEAALPMTALRWKGRPLSRGLDEYWLRDHDVSDGWMLLRYQRYIKKYGWLFE